jgi:hypothetical protein
VIVDRRKDVGRKYRVRESEKDVDVMGKDKGQSGRIKD